MSKPVIIGMNNPISADPKHALYPVPPGSAGGRLYAMLKERLPNITMRQYRDGFSRVNLVQGRWSLHKAKLVGPAFRELLSASEKDVLVLGNEAWDALGLPQSQGPLWKLELDGVRWRLIPHPSGRNRWYDDPANRIIVGMILEELIRRET